jgi:hypothetical protein
MARGADMGVEFCLLAENGALADQAVLLCQSIRHFAGKYASASVTVISPRKERRPSREHILALERSGAEYVELSLVSPEPEYGTSFRVLALAWCAERSGAEILVQLDSDTIFLGEPDIRTGETGMAARPVDATGMCSSGPDDPFDAVWKRIAALCNVDLEAIPFLLTTIDRRRVRASYNGGLIVAPRNIYPIVSDFFLRILHEGVRPFASSKHGLQAGSGPVSAEGFKFWGTSQAAISMALAATNMPIRILDHDHNVPVHMMDEFSGPVRCPIHLHYHWMFAAANTASQVLQHKNLVLSTDQRTWLAAAIDGQGLGLRRAG